jgi:hypothetical protein
VSIRQHLQWCPDVSEVVATPDIARFPLTRQGLRARSRVSSTNLRSLSSPKRLGQLAGPSAASGPHTTSPRVHRRGETGKRTAPCPLQERRTGVGEQWKRKPASFGDELSGSRSFWETGWLLSLREPLVSQRCRDKTQKSRRFGISAFSASCHCCNRGG